MSWRRLPMTLAVLAFLAWVVLTWVYGWGWWVGA